MITPEQDVKTGVPEGFFKNRALVLINKGSLRPDLKGDVPKEIKCWKEGCDQPLVVCGFPFYICGNDHAFNLETGEKWNWKPYDEVYHGLLRILQGHIQPTYQKLFFPQSRKREDTEANSVSTQLSHIGRMLYDRLNIQEEDRYQWGRDNFRHFAGLRFAINMMSEALRMRRKVMFPSDLKEGGIRDLNELYDYDADGFRATLGDDQIRKTMLTVETVRKALPKQQRQATFGK